jgi:hypothetical protein
MKRSGSWPFATRVRIRRLDKLPLPAVLEEATPLPLDAVVSYIPMPIDGLVARRNHKLFSHFRLIGRSGQGRIPASRASASAQSLLGKAIAVGKQGHKVKSRAWPTKVGPLSTI